MNHSQLGVEKYSSEMSPGFQKAKRLSELPTDRDGSKDEQSDTQGRTNGLIL